MKYWLLSLIFLFLLCFNLSAQCPEGVLEGTPGGSTNIKCIELSWSSPPSPLDTEIIANGITYTYASGSGTSADPALYRDGNNCGGVNEYLPFTGNLDYDGMTCTYQGGVLPVVWSDISIEYDDGAIIHWNTKSELNNDFFAIERSKDGQNWKEIGTIDGSGTSQLENQYSYWDSKPLNGISHYRVKQVDFDHSFSYSEIVSYTNPLSTSNVILRAASEELIIYNEDEHNIYTLRNMSGQIILSGKLIRGNNLISVPELQPGVHIVTISGIITQSFKVVSY